MTATTDATQQLLPLASPAATLAIAGGKGANLARLAAAGFPVPGGFVVTTRAYRAFVAANGLAAVIDAALANLDCSDPAALEQASQRIRTNFATGVMASSFAAAVAAAYAALGSPPVAVRSSATAEDLPDLSFAGQQDTYLNVQGIDALQQAIVGCWSSLWTARAIGYRARNDIPQHEVALAVVVQEMVASAAAGVLFTANPLTGKRSETVIDATLGLGEALVSGQVEPDHYGIDSASATVLRKTLGAKATVITGRAGGGTVTTPAKGAAVQAIPDPVIVELTQLGQRVAASFGSPQDIEWAWADGKLSLLRSRPITSLFPLPAGMEAEPLKVMMAFSAVQGIFEPLTPLGQDTMKLVLTGGGRVFGYQVDLEHQQTFYTAAERLYIDFSPVLGTVFGRNVLPKIIGAIDPGVAQAFGAVIHDPRLQPKGRGVSLDAARRLLGFALPMARRILKVWRQPDAERRRVTNLMDAKVAETAARLAPTGDLWLDYTQRLQALVGARDSSPKW